MSQVLQKPIQRSEGAPSDGPWRIAVSDGCQALAYPRNQELLRALTSLIAQAPISIHTGTAPWNSIQSLPRYIFQTLRFASQGRVDANVVFVLTSDYASVLPLRLNRLFHRGTFKIVYDPFISLFDTHVYNKPLPWRPFRNTILRWIDRTAFWAADRLLMDTDAHADYLSRLLSVPRTKFRKVLVGFNRDIFTTRPVEETFWQQPLRVLWYGQPTALHGFKTLLEAILLSSEKISFTLVFPLKNADPELLSRIRKLSRVTLIDWTSNKEITFDRLKTLLEQHQIALGGFGDTEKARSVVMNKEFETLAMGRALITRSGRREFLRNGRNCLQVPPEDPAALAAGLQSLEEDREKLRAIATQGQHDVEQVVPRQYTVNRLSSILHELLDPPQAIRVRSRPLEDVRLAMSMEVKNTPWGGSNQFVASFKNYFEEKGAIVSSRLDGAADLIILIDPRTWTGTFTHKDIIRFKRRHPGVKVLHRINECDERKGTHEMDALLKEANVCADFTVFISEWLRDYFKERWFDAKRPHANILNGADETIFNSQGQEPWSGKGPLRFVTHHWGDHWMKGFDVYTHFDTLLADPAFRERFELTVIGRWPKGVQFQNARTVAPLNGLPLATELRKHHAYITASRSEPCGMHHIEGASCGLPVLFAWDGGGIVECCRDFGQGFDRKELPAALEQMRGRYMTIQPQMNNYTLTATHSMEQYEQVIRTMLALN